MAEPQTAPKQHQGPTRIPVKKIWFREGEYADMPGGNSMAAWIECRPQSHPGRQFFVAHFVPAHQVIEIEYFQHEKAEPQLMRLPIASLKRFD